MEFPRKEDLDALINKKGNHLVKVITGLRKVGKSYLLSTLFKKHLLNAGVPLDHIIEADLSLSENENLHDKKALRDFILKRVKDNGMYYLLLDEIQEAKGFSSLLLSLNKKPNFDIYVTGSNSRMLSRDIETDFRGTADPVRLFPIRFKEFLPLSGMSPEVALSHYLDYGGMPLQFSKNSDLEREKYLRGLFETVYLADIEDRHDLRNKPAFELLSDVLSSDIGSLTNPAKIEKTLKSSHYKLTNDTIATYISYLTDAFLFEECKRFDIKGKSHISSPLKYYCGDIGLRNARLHFNEQEYQNIIENAVYLDLRSRGYEVDVGVIPHRETDLESKKQIDKNYEIDFIVNKGNEKVYVQVAMDMDTKEKYQQEAKPFSLVGDSFRKVFVLRRFSQTPRFDEKGYFVMSLLDFLENSQLI
ncbi:MAG: ATP-binding protein [Bacilli bacterium]|jgi:predicted AAA+ superfamily ATPase|nr:ATP-binding protein [Bacilli bacterium]